MYVCSRQVCFKELKIKLILLNLKHGAQRSHSEACSLKKCTLPYIYFVFKCLVLYFGIRKEWLEKKMNTFSLAANILKLDIRSCTLDQAWIVKWISGHILVSHYFAYMVIVCIKLWSVYWPLLTLNHISYRNNSTLLP